MIPETELAAWEQLCQAATEAPWFVDSNISAVREGPGGNIRYGKMVCALYHGYHDDSPNDLPQDAKAPNLAFIAAARDALPRLLAEVRRLRGQEDGA